MAGVLLLSAVGPLVLYILVVVAAGGFLIRFEVVITDCDYVWCRTDVDYGNFYVIDGD